MAIQDQVRFVLINTTHPGNIGAAARALKNMGFSRLYLVNPRQFPHEEATARASGADDILNQAHVCSNLDSAIADCSLVIGTSARMRALPWPYISPREAAAKTIMAASHTQVAILFGAEKTGLTNQELERCHYLLNIPANPDYSSLNLAAAVQIMSYELNLALTQDAKVLDWQDSPLATAGETEGFYEQLEQTLYKLEFVDPNNPRQIMRRLRRLFNRAQLEKTEVNILRGILTAVHRKI